MSRAWLAAGALACLAAASAAAEGADPADVARLEACTAAHLPDVLAAEAACIGRIADPCMGTAEGSTTLGMVDCMGGESAAWDVLLNRDWPELMARAKASDADYAATWQGTPPPSWADALRTAQRAWIAFRDAECGERHASWGAGSMRHIEAAGCWMRLTAERTLALRARLVAER